MLVDEFLAELREVPTTVDADGFAGDEVGLTQQQNRLGNFRLAAPVADGRGLGDFVHFCRFISLIHADQEMPAQAPARLEKAP